MSVSTNVEGRRIENAEGRESEGVVAGVGVGEDVVDGVAVVAQGASEPGGAPEDVSGAALDERVGRVGGLVEQGVFGAQGAVESAQGSQGEIDDDDLGGDEESAQIGGGHLGLRAAAGLALGA